MKVTWNTDNTITVNPPKRPKKITGTRFASILNLNKWSSAFQTWCEITKTVNIPFEDTKYTLAGKVIEPKQITYVKEILGEVNLVKPEDVWGKDYFDKKYGNFFSHPIFGGMWDSLVLSDEIEDSEYFFGGDVKNKVTAVYEFKTTSRPQDWQNENGVIQAPEYYKLQAALYAWLLRCDRVVMPVSFLFDSDYDDPEDFMPSASNTGIYEFSVSEEYPNFIEDYLVPAEKFWNEFVLEGESPVFDEKRDKEYLDLLRTNSLNPTTDIDTLCKELKDCQDFIDAAQESVKEKLDRAKAIKEQLKTFALENIGSSDIAEFKSNDGLVICKLTKSTKENVDINKMKADNVFDKYKTTDTTTRFTVSFKEEK